MKEIVSLFISFMKIGAFMFGGGYAMLPILHREIVVSKKWVTDEELLDYFAVAQCTPGVIAVNTATFVGHKRKGVIGGIVATLGVVSVPVIIICIIATALKSFSHFTIVQNAMWGIRIAVCAVITSSLYKLFKKSISGIFGILVFVVSAVTGIFLDISPIYTIVIAGVLGILVQSTIYKNKEEA